MLGPAGHARSERPAGKKQYTLGNAEKTKLNQNTRQMLEKN